MTAHKCPNCDEAACVCKTVHKLKTWPGFMDKIVSGEKTFEYRKNDRDYQVGDILCLQEFCPKEQRYLDRDHWAEVTYVMTGGFGMQPGYAVLALKPFVPESRLMDHARRELRLMGYSEAEEGVNKWLKDSVLDIIRVFTLQGHSGGTAGYVVPILEKLLKHDPLTPLTGEDHEWDDVSHFGDPTVKWQNKRCSRVLKGDDGVCFDVGARVLVFPDGTTVMDPQCRTDIQFPYVPMVEIVEVNEEGVPL